ncbi:TetR/AcrR family transcriptional regulator [Gordonia soli]|uniref:Putative TetR family transcriptional regulator n=1 Tax=Gordonia soli NBRC 108243 TaxID=1223545 RepID=M0QHW2_9ACTN|nr:TetR/AcrR family transcriptional regulator [Gordonia soli]GAC68034.1 putative TetR family transcriptional regulator [Gordonia soli NBRC 108243]
MPDRDTARRRPPDWLASDRTDLAREKILDVAADLFVTDGVAAVTMRGLAGAVGCSRATLYRYFPNKSEVLAAYVERAALTLGAAIADDLHGPGTPGDRLIRAISAAVSGVRDHPALAAWFTPDASGDAAQIAVLSPGIEAIATGFLREIAPDGSEADRVTRARWLVRVILSLLSTPGTDAADERAMIERFVLPVVLPDGRAG